MLILILSHKLWSTAAGTWYYEDSMTWIVALLVLASLVWLLVPSYLRGRALRRRPRPANYRRLKEVVKRKRELSSRYLRPGFSGNIHAVGIGMSGSDYCIQIFIHDRNDELWAGAGIADLPASYRGTPVVPIEMPFAGFLSGEDDSLTESSNTYPRGIREPQEVIIGGISGANTNLTGESGTIGYFCTRRSKLPRRKETYLLSNSHVFADLRKAGVDEGDLILQPSPGEPASNRPIGALTNFAPVKFDRGLNDPNHIDAAIAKLWAPQHKALLPLIGAVKGYVETKDVEIGEPVRKFGRTTGYTEGKLFSICLDIWIRYERTGQKAFFMDQFLVEPAGPRFEKFVSGGDSGSLLVDSGQHAIGLIFAGKSELPQSSSAPNPVTKIDPAADQPVRIEGYGVANPIRDVLDELKIDLLI
jgi:hypothetical protein